DRDGPQAMGLSLRCQRRAPALQGSSEIGVRAQGRSVPQPRRGIAPRRRLCKGHHPVQRISVGGFSAPQNLAQKRGREFRQGDGEGAQLCQEQGRGVPARLVRTPRLNSGYVGSLSEKESGGSCPVSSLPPSLLCSQRSIRPPTVKTAKVMTNATITNRHCPRPQTIPIQAASQVQAALVSPRTLK